MTVFQTICHKIDCCKEYWVDIKGSNSILFWIFNGESVTSFVVRYLLFIVLIFLIEVVLFMGFDWMIVSYFKYIH